MGDAASAHLNAILRKLGQDLVASGGQPTFDSLVGVALSGVSKKEAFLIQADVAKIIARNLSDAELNRWWRDGPSEVYFYRDGDVRSFLEIVAKRLEVLAST